MLPTTQLEKLGGENRGRRRASSDFSLFIPQIRRHLCGILRQRTLAGPTAQVENGRAPKSAAGGSKRHEPPQHPTSTEIKRRV